MSAARCWAAGRFGTDTVGYKTILTECGRLSVLTFASAIARVLTGLDTTTRPAQLANSATPPGTAPRRWMPPPAAQRVTPACPPCFTPGAPIPDSRTVCRQDPLTHRRAASGLGGATAFHTG